VGIWVRKDNQSNNKKKKNTAWGEKDIVKPTKQGANFVQIKGQESKQTPLSGVGQKA